MFRYDIILTRSKWFPENEYEKWLCFLTTEWFFSLMRIQMKLIYILTYSIDCDWRNPEDSNYIFKLSFKYQWQWCMIIALCRLLCYYHNNQNITQSELPNIRKPLQIFIVNLTHIVYFTHNFKHGIFPLGHFEYYSVGCWMFQDWILLNLCRTKLNINAKKHKTSNEVMSYDLNERASTCLHVWCMGCCKFLCFFNLNPRALPQW